MIRQSRATAVWKGDLKSGMGTVSAGSGIFKDVSYSFKTRFEDAPGTNPEELIAAAEAACFSMAFAAELSKIGIAPESIHTIATATLDHVAEKPTVSEVHLQVEVRVGKDDREAVYRAAETARSTCPISRLLNTKVTLGVNVL